MASAVLSSEAETKESWVPMIAIALGQAIMSFNVASLSVSIGGMVESFDVVPTTIGTTIVMYSLAVAGFVMLGAKLVQRFGATRVFRTVALVFNVLVIASPKELAGDVGALRGTAQDLAAAVGTAVVGALLVGLLSSMVLQRLGENPALPSEITAQLDLDSITFSSNDRLLGVMQTTTATPEQVEEAVRINTEVRLRALRIGLLIVAGLAFVTIFPAGRLPDYKPGDIPADPPPAPPMAKGELET